MFPVDSGLPPLPTGEEVHAIEYSSFCRRIAIGTTAGNVHIYDNTQRQPALIQTLPPRAAGPSTVSWSRDGEILLTTNQNGWVDLYNRQTTNAHAPAYQLVWSNHGQSAPVACSAFSSATSSTPVAPLQQPQQRGFGAQAQAAKPKMLSFAYGALDGTITTVFVNPTTAQWSTKTQEKIHILGVTAIHFIEDASGNAIIWTGGADGWCRTNTITYEGELLKEWQNVRVSLKPIIDLVAHAGTDNLSALDKTGAIYLLKQESGSYSVVTGIKSDPESRARQLIWIAERSALCTISQGGSVLCLVQENSQLVRRKATDVLGM